VRLDERLDVACNGVAEAVREHLAEATVADLVGQGEGLTR
jgi:hypothetical protein